jgi:hypothetical protein
MSPRAPAFAQAITIRRSPSPVLYCVSKVELSVSFVNWVRGVQAVSDEQADDHQRDGRRGPRYERHGDADGQAADLYRPDVRGRAMIPAERGGSLNQHILAK